MGACKGIGAASAGWGSPGRVNVSGFASLFLRKTMRMPLNMDEANLHDPEIKENEKAAWISTVNTLLLWTMNTVRDS